MAIAPERGSYTLHPIDLIHEARLRLGGTTGHHADALVGVPSVRDAVPLALTR